MGTGKGVKDVPLIEEMEVLGKRLYFELHYRGRYSSFRRACESGGLVGGDARLHPSVARSL